MGFLSGQDCLIHQAGHHRISEGSGHVRLVQALTLLFCLVGKVQESRLQPGKGIIIPPFCVGMGQLKRMRIAFLRQCVNARTTGVRKPQHTSCLVEGFASRIIKGLPKQGIYPVILHPYQMAMPAGYHQAHKGGLQVRMGQIIGGHVTFNVIHRNQGLLQGVA